MTALLGLTPMLVAIAPPELSTIYLGVVPFRFFAVPALTIPEYYGFFQDNPVTYMSHVSGFSWILDYPYDTGIPRVIGNYFYGNPELNCNSGFWAGDGLTGFGPVGILILSVFCAFVFWLFDWIARETDPRFVAVAMTFIGFSFSSTSLFTTLVTGGWLLLMFAILVMPRAGLLECAFARSDAPATGGG
jgi:hypothetical protein